MDFAERPGQQLVSILGPETRRSVAVAGGGGLGSPLVQHLALLGVGRIAIIDDEDLDDTNRNRFVGARHNDPVPGSAKVAILARLVAETNPEVETLPIGRSLISEEAFDAIRASDVAFGCFDHDGPRAILNELCAAYEKHYFDLASDIADATAYGGRVCASINGLRCLVCSGEIDSVAVDEFVQSKAQREARDKIYGVNRSVLSNKGPSVAPLNGVIASLAAMEFMAFVTGMRPPNGLLNYLAHQGKVTVSSDQPRVDCYICKSVRGRGARADVERYLRLPHLRSAR